jgi:hypothetical protein
MSVAATKNGTETILGGAMDKLSLLRELWGFLKERKKWWLFPIMLFLLLLSALIIFTSGSAIAPFVYTLF